MKTPPDSISPPAAGRRRRGVDGRHHTATLAGLGEFGAIALIAQTQRGADLARWQCAIGDDAAVLAPGHGRRALLVTVDALVEGRHFYRHWSAPEEIAQKLLACNVSDIAAMGGRPLGAVLALGAPADLPVGWLQRFARGIARAGRLFACPLVGGDTVASDNLFLSLTVLGEIAQRRAILRSEAQPGNVLCVTGSLGESALGHHLLTQLPAGAEATPVRRQQLARRYGPGTAAALRRHLRGQARPRAGTILAAHGARAMIDISDGLASEAWHIARDSGVQIHLEEGAIPLAPIVRRVARALGVDPHSFALYGGEDYELLVALPPRRVAAAMAAVSAHGGTSLRVIGRVEKAGKPAVYLTTRAGERRPLAARGFDHFRQETR